MSYASRSDFAAAFTAAELAQLETGRGGSYEAAADGADGEINSYLAGRYALPLPSVPARLKSVAMDIARYRLYDDAGDENSVWVRRYREAVKWLRDVAHGLAVLTDDSGQPLPGPSAPVGAGGIAAGSPVRVYGPRFDREFGRYGPQAGGA